MEILTKWGSQSSQRAKVCNKIKPPVVGDIINVKKMPFETNNGRYDRKYTVRITDIKDLGTENIYFVEMW